MSDFDDNDFVYVDPGKRKIVSKVEYLQNGQVKPLEMTEESSSASDEATEDKEPENTEKGKKRPKRRKRKRYYPWCSYRTAKRVYRVEGKEKEIENYRSLDEVMELAQKEAFWD